MEDFLESVTTSSLFSVLSAFPALSYDRACTIPLNDSRGRSFGQADVFLNQGECPIRVVQLTLRISHMSEIHHRLLLISDDGSFIPHFSLHLAQMGTQFAFSVDLIPRIPDLEKYPEYGEQIFEGLDKHRDRIHTLRTCEIAPSGTAVPSSPHAISAFLGHEDVDSIRSAIQGFLTHWLFIANDERTFGNDLRDAVDVMDLRLRSVLLSHRVDPVVAMIGWMCGEEVVDQLRSVAVWPVETKAEEFVGDSRAEGAIEGDLGGEKVEAVSVMGAVVDGVMNSIPMQEALPAVDELSSKLEKFKSSVIHQVANTRRPSKDDIIASLLSPVFSEKPPVEKSEVILEVPESDATEIDRGDAVVTIGPLRGGARSVAIAVENHTRERLHLKDKVVSSGIWSLLPPSVTPAGGTTYCITESDKYLQGTQGALILASDLVKGDFYIKWSNPYAGKCEYEVRCAESFVIERDYMKGQGKHVSVLFRISHFDSIPFAFPLSDPFFRTCIFDTSLDPHATPSTPAPLERAAAICKWVKVQSPVLDVVVLQNVFSDAALSVIESGLKGYNIISKIGAREVFTHTQHSGQVLATVFPIVHSEFHQFAKQSLPSSGVNKGVSYVLLDTSSRIPNSRTALVLSHVTANAKLCWETIYNSVSFALSRDSAKSEHHLCALLMGTFYPLPTVEISLRDTNPTFVPIDTHDPRAASKLFTFDPENNGLIVPTEGVGPNRNVRIAKIDAVFPPQSPTARDLLVLECVENTIQGTGSSALLQLSESFPVTATFRAFQE